METATAIPGYETMSTVDLRGLVRERGLAKGSAVASARKEDLISLLTGDVTSLEVPVMGSDSLADIIAAAVSGRVKAGVDPEQVNAMVDEKMAALIGSEAFKDAVAAVAPQVKIEQKVINLPGKPAITMDEHTHKMFEKVLRLVALNLPVFLVGPAGTGKTTLAEQVAKALGKRWSFNSMSAGVSESHIIGRTLPDSTGNWTYKPSPFVVTYRDGGVHLFDEVDAADANLMVLINAPLANGHLSIPFEDMIIKRHPDTTIILAANTFGTGANRQYVGRNALDAATLDRCAVSTVEIGYDEDLERKLVAKILTNTDLAETWMDECWRVRSRISDSGLRRILSTRTMVNGSLRLAAGDKPADVWETYFTPWQADEKQRVN
jgi:MoxR-like ATPase